MSTNIRYLWWVQIGISLYYPLIAPVLGMSIATLIPLVLSAMSSLALLTHFNSSVRTYSLAICILMLIALSSTIIEANTTMLVAAVKNIWFIPVYSVYKSLVLRNTSEEQRTLCIDKFFHLSAIVCGFTLIEMASRLLNPLNEIINTYYTFIQAPGMAYLSHGELTGIFSGPYTLGFYGDSHTSAGLSLVNFCYFMYRRKAILAQYSLLTVASSMSTTSLFASAVIFITFILTSVQHFAKVLYLVGLSINATLLVYAFPDRFVEKISGQSLQTLKDHTTGGIASLDFSNLIIGSGYASEGLTAFKESAFVEYIYMYGLLFHLIPLIILIWPNVSGNVKTLTKSTKNKIPGNQRYKFRKIDMIIVILIYFALTCHYNQLYNPATSLGLVLLVDSLNKRPLGRRQVQT